MSLLVNNPGLLIQLYLWNKKHFLFNAGSTTGCQIPN